MQFPPCNTVTRVVSRDVRANPKVLITFDFHRMGFYSLSTQLKLKISRIRKTFLNLFRLKYFWNPYIFVSTESENLIVLAIFEKVLAKHHEIPADLSYFELNKTISELISFQKHPASIFIRCGLAL